MKWQIINKAQEYKIKVNKNEAIGVVMPINKGGQYRVIVDLLGQGARALILGIIIGKGKDMIDLTTETRHVVGNTHAETMIHGVNQDESMTEIRGMIRIDKKADQVTDFLTEKVLLLSDRARATAVPSLEIKAHEVRASHAATVAKLDEEQIYYLMSRGLSRQQSEELMVQGFLQTVVNKIEDDKIRNQICLMLKQ
ncbi:MAG: SufD family Fe-S cluster assembly protein [Patescibacteria group bacterium]